MDNYSNNDNIVIVREGRQDRTRWRGEMMSFGCVVWNGWAGDQDK